MQLTQDQDDPEANKMLTRNYRFGYEVPNKI